ncbi:nardilysin-like [Actinia tenebrosa]|uniref:Nardilysin-like n=1 Tax=Actinia tenebrosa TaxID=6105 RepID=A0A6P8I916_ACTTE|nr:nardilysin-like [Actinia tenebrosa]
MAVVKSPNDPRDYRVIHLDNGLTALLISDTNTVSSRQRHHSSHSSSYVSDTEESDDSDDESNEGSEIEDDDVTETMGTSDNKYDDDEEEEEEEEENIKKEHDKYSKPDAKLAAAALCIGTGSFSDPNEIPGLAHFLEHMVFMGSQKYPDENAFDAFIKKHGGNSNASTDCERTVFVFDIRRKYLKEALDRFAQFFISPLLKEGSVDREIQAVESEFKQSYHSDTVKKMQLLQSLSRDCHPYKKFLWGNEETLKNIPKEKGIDVQNHLKSYQKRMYSAQYMTLALCSKESLDTLEEWVKEFFAEIPNNLLPKPTFQEFPPPFEDSFFTKLYKVLPVKDINQLEITWVLPCQQEHYRIKPMHYVSWLLGHEGPGSVLSFLIKRSWAVSLMCGNGETGIEHNTNMALFPCLVNLTDEGMKHIFEIITIIFQYLEMLRQIGPQQRIYDEIQTIEKLEFLFQEQCEPYDYVENLVENMQLYPEEDFLTGDQLMWEFNPKVISNALDLLTPDKANIAISSKSFKDECSEVEPWFQTSYKSIDIDLEWKKAWTNLQLNPELHIPTENIFIATDFEIKEKDVKSPEFPVVILDNDFGKVWHRKDDKFNTPRARYYFHLISPNVNHVPASMVLTEIFLKVLEYNLKEISYAADVAQLSYSMNIHETGIVLKLDGFNHKLPLLFKTIVDYFVNFVVNEQTFNMVKKQLTRVYRNIIIKPQRLARSVRLSILQLVKWTIVDKRGAIDKITLKDVENFASSFKSQLYVESLIQGNVTSEEAICLQEYLCSKLNPSPLQLGYHPKIRVVELPCTESICRIAGFNKDDTNTVVTNYYQSGPASVEDFAVMELLIMKMEEPCFDILRTREQLGYSVFCACRNTFGIIGFSVTVQSQAEKFSVTHIQSRIDSFLEEFKGILETTKDKDFQSQVDSLIELKQHEDLSLADETNKNWYEVLDQTYLFDRNKREIEALRKLTKEDVIQCYKSHMKNGDKYKKLSIQIVGSGDSEVYGSNITDGLKENLQDGLPEESDDEGCKEEWVLRPLHVVKEESICILDTADFKRTRPVYPVSQIN